MLKNESRDLTRLFFMFFKFDERNSEPRDNDTFHKAMVARIQYEKDLQRKYTQPCIFHTSKGLAVVPQKNEIFHSEEQDSCFSIRKAGLPQIWIAEADM